MQSSHVAGLESPVHRAAPLLKAGVAAALVFLVALTPRGCVLPLVAVGVVLVLIALLSRIPPGYLLKRLLLLEPFSIGVALLSLFQPGGMQLFAMIVVKSTLSLTTMILFAGTTSFPETLRVLQRLRVPALLVTTLALLHRYLSVLLEESARMRIARASRTFRRSRRLNWRMLGSVAGELFVRSTERAGRIYNAMCSRGFK